MEPLTLLGDNRTTGAGGKAVATAVFLAVGAGVMVVRAAPGSLALALLAVTFSLAALVARDLNVAAPAYVLSLSGVHLIKRLVFAFGSQPRWLYFGVLLIPTVFGVAALLATRRARVAAPRASFFLLVFGGLLLASSLLSPVGGGPIVRIATLHERVAPFLGFFIGLGLPLHLHACRRGIKVAVLACLVAVPVGFWQAFIGVTHLERYWAKEAADFSTHAFIVDQYLSNHSEDLRGFGWFADHTTWGFWLVAAVVAILAGTRKRTFARRCGLGLILLGLVATETRTPFLGLAATLACFWMLRFRATRRPTLLMAAALIAFALLLSAFSALYSRFDSQSTALYYDSPSLIGRFGYVGTLNARIPAWEALPEAIASNSLLGKGPSYLELAEREQFQGLSTDVDPGKHNILVELAVTAGLPGLLAFLGFLFNVFRTSVVGLLAVRPHEHVELRWLVALVFGLFLTGYANGSAFLSELYYLLCGMAMATAMGLPRADVRGPLTVEIQQ